VAVKSKGGSAALKREHQPGPRKPLLSDRELIHDHDAKVKSLRGAKGTVDKRLARS
jgi:hypothetical protein